MKRLPLLLLLTNIAFAAEANSGLQNIRSRETNPRQPLVITVGSIQGGQRENILAERLEFAGTVRTDDDGFGRRMLGEVVGREHCRKRLRLWVGDRRS